MSGEILGAVVAKPSVARGGQVTADDGTSPLVWAGRRGPGTGPSAGAETSAENRRWPPAQQAPRSCEGPREPDWRASERSERGPERSEGRRADARPRKEGDPSARPAEPGGRDGARPNSVADEMEPPVQFPAFPQNHTAESEYEHDAERGRTVKRTPEGETEYHGDLYQRHESASGVEHRFFVFSPHGLVATEVRGTGSAESATYYVHLDRQGSPVMISSPGLDGLTPEIVGAREYDAFGKLTTPAGDYVPSVNIGYTGHEDELELGFINMGGRLYDPRLGQMLQPDPFVRNPYQSQSLNRYAYAFNNPLKFVDPTGFAAVPGSEIGDPISGLPLETLPGSGVTDISGLPGLGYSQAIRQSSTDSGVDTTPANEQWAQEPGPGAGNAEALVPAPVETPSALKILAIAAAQAGVDALVFAAAAGGVLYVGYAAHQGLEEDVDKLFGGPKPPAGGSASDADAGEALVTPAAQEPTPQADGAGALDGPPKGSTPHGDQRAREAREGDVNREVGDANRVIREGQSFRDTETGNRVYVKGNRVVITAPMVDGYRSSRIQGRIHSVGFAVGGGCPSETRCSLPSA